MQQKAEAPPLRAPRKVGGVWTLEAYAKAQAKGSGPPAPKAASSTVAESSAKKFFAVLRKQEQLQWGRDSALWWACTQKKRSTSGSTLAQSTARRLTDNSACKESSTGVLISDPQVVQLHFQLMCWDPSERPTAIPPCSSIRFADSPGQAYDGNTSPNFRSSSSSSSDGPNPNEVDLEALRYLCWHRKYDPSLTPVLQGALSALVLEAATVLLAGSVPAATSPNNLLEKKWPSGVLFWNDPSSPPPPPPSYEPATHRSKTKGDSSPVTTALLLRPYFVQPRKTRSRSGSTNRFAGEEEWNQDALHVLKDLLAAAKPQKPSPSQPLKFLAAPRVKGSLPPPGSVVALVSRFTPAWQHAQRRHRLVSQGAVSSSSSSSSSNSSSSHMNKHGVSVELNENGQTIRALSLVAALIVHGPQSHEVSKAVKSMQRPGHSQSSSVHNHHHHHRCNVASSDFDTNTIAASTRQHAMHSPLPISSIELSQANNSSGGAEREVRWLARFMLSAAVGWLLRRADSEEREGEAKLQGSVTETHAQQNINEESTSRTSSDAISSTIYRPYRTLLVSMWQHYSETDTQRYSSDDVDFLMNAFGWSPDLSQGQSLPRMRQPRLPFLNLVRELDCRRRQNLHGLHRSLRHEGAIASSRRNPLDSGTLNASVAQLSPIAMSPRAVPVPQQSIIESKNTITAASAPAAAPSIVVAATAKTVTSSIPIAPPPDSASKPDIGAMLKQEALDSSGDSSSDEDGDSSIPSSESQSFDFEHYFAAQVAMLNAPLGSRTQAEATDEVAALRRSLRASMANLAVSTPLQPPPPPPGQPAKTTTATAFSQLLLTGAAKSIEPAVASASSGTSGSTLLHVEASRAAEGVASQKKTSAQSLPDKDSMESSAKIDARNESSGNTTTCRNGYHGRAKYSAEHQGQPNNGAWHAKRKAFVESTVKWMTTDGPSPVLDGLLAGNHSEATTTATRAETAAATHARKQLAQFLVCAFLDLRPALGRCLWDPASATGTIVTEVSALEE